MSKLTHKQIGDGLVYLGFEHWAISGTDYDNMLLWESDQPKPSITEIEAAVEALEQECANVKAAKAAARESAVAKLAALGLNDAEVKAIVGGDLEGATK